VIPVAPRRFPLTRAQCGNKCGSELWGCHGMGEGLDFVTRIQRVRLSGWARLWIVLLGLFWAVSAWSNVTSESQNWRTVCDWPDCSKIPVVSSEEYQIVPYNNDGSRRSKYSSSPLGSPDKIEVTARNGKTLQFPTDTKSEVVARVRIQYDAERKAEALSELKRRNDLRLQHAQRLASGVVSPALIALLAFALAMFSKAAVLWIWRGFREPKGL
jgi:hypothetical protein